MNEPQPTKRHLVEPDPEAAYSIEVVAQITGVSSQTIVHFQEQGFISPLPRRPAEPLQFDDEAVRRLRRIEHLRTQCGVSGPALALMVRLLDEVEHLRSELRARRLAGLR